MRDVDQRAIVETRNAIGPEMMRRISYSHNHSPVDMAILPDADSNGVPEIAVLLTRESDSRQNIEVRNGFGPSNARKVLLGKNFTATRVEGVIDGTVNVAALSTRNSDGRTVVQVRRVSDGSNLGYLYYRNPNFTPVDFIVLPNVDANPAPEIAVLLVRNDGRPLVSMRNASGLTSMTDIFFLNENFVPYQIGIGTDIDGNSVPDVGVLAIRESDDRVVTEIRNAAGPELPTQIWF
jgi:hypothetical protein